jgi:UDP-galactopyranose mutase
LDSAGLEKFFEEKRERVEKIETSEDVVVNTVGRELYEKFFRGYTRKQWGLDPSELSSQVTARIPTRTNRDDRYFTDAHQAMPLHGFTKMFENMLDHENITIQLSTDYRDIKDSVPYREMIYTGPIDEFFDFRYGKLPYRSLEFRHETHDVEKYQDAPVVNYPDENVPHTRITEFKYLSGQEHPKTSIVYEYPRAEGDPYYPIPRPQNAEINAKYQALVNDTPGLYFVGVSPPTSITTWTRWSGRRSRSTRRSAARTRSRNPRRPCRWRRSPRRHAARSSAARSESTISRTRSGNATCARHPRTRSAFAALPTSCTGSAGRSNAGSCFT